MAAVQPEISFLYPIGLEPPVHFDPRVEAVGRMFMELLFAKRPEGMEEPFTAQTHPLSKIVHPDFKEVLDGKITISSLQELVEYRANYREPTLLKADMLAARPHRGYNFSTLTEFVFNLPEGAPQFPARVRMWESLDIRPSAEDPNKFLVYGRTYTPLGAVGLLETVNAQHDFVNEQVAHFVDNNGELMQMDPWRDVYQHVFPGAHFEQPE